MMGTRCLFNSSTALVRVFMPTAPGRAELSLQLPMLLAPRLCFESRSRRNLHSRVRRIVPGEANRGGPGQKYKLAAGRLPRDEEITQRFVLVRQADGSLSEPVLTHAVLSKLDSDHQSLVVVALPDPNNDNAPKHPICKIVNKEAEFKAQKEKAKEQRKKAVQTKEMELNWAIDPHDLDHRLKKLRTFLEKGYRVEVLLLRKDRKKRQASQDEAREVLRRVKEVVAEVPGAKESKPMAGEVLRSLKLFFEGPRQE